MSKEIGSQGEVVVAKFLEDKNYKILAKNFRSLRGEIDIIALSEDRLRFIEVKTMLHLDIENISLLINNKKQAKIIQTAKQFIADNRKYSEMNMSFDVAVLKTNPFWKVEPEIVYIENVFGDMDA
ncbi:MAG: YraN family protein [Treponemataceae bacterium]